jgi:hypothetical protein
VNGAKEAKKCSRRGAEIAKKTRRDGGLTRARGSPNERSRKATRTPESSVAALSLNDTSVVRWLLSAAALSEWRVDLSGVTCQAMGGVGLEAHERRP